VFFTQHPAEIVRSGLWARWFFVACRNLFGKVIVRRRGEPKVDSSGVFGEWKPDDFGGLRGPSRGCKFSR
jgi:hypothetical protein